MWRTMDAFSWNKLAGAVTGLGGMGAISSVELLRLRPDLMATTGHLNKEVDALVAGPVCRPLPFGDQIRTVCELMRWLPGGIRPVALT